MFLGKKKLRSNVFYSPLAGCSDYPFRQMSAKWQPGLMYCEMVKMEALIRRVPAVMKMLAYQASMRPIGAQLVGSDISIAAESAKIVEDLGFDVIDYNCGCPVDKVTQDGSGSGMLKNPERIGEMITELKKRVSIPVTVKIRAGWSEEEIVADTITRIAEAAGADAIAIHGRTRKQAYRGPANWEWIKICVEAAKNIKVIGNGDVFSPEAAEKMLSETGCDAVLVSRATMGAPWIAEDIASHLRGQSVRPRTFEEKKGVLLEHVDAILRFHGEKKALIDIRRVGCWYLKDAKNMAEYRKKISHAKSLEEARMILQEVMDAGY